MSNGEGCKCASRSASECCCDDVNWNNAALSAEHLNIIFDSEGIPSEYLALSFLVARAIEKAHGIVKKKPLSGTI